MVGADVLKGLVDVPVKVNNGEPMLGDLRITQDRIAPDCMPLPHVPDLAWRFPDARGHVHRYDDAGRLPTLTVRSAPCECPPSALCRCLTLLYACRICGPEGGVIEPPRIEDQDTLRASVPGLLRWEVWALAREGHTYPDELVTVEVVAGAGVTLFGLAREYHVRQALDNDRNPLPGLLHVRYKGDGPLARNSVKPIVVDPSDRILAVVAA
jgi:hypothetical protein